MISFGTGGWRAIIADGFTKLNVQRLARALALRMKAEDVQDKSFCIGYDRRFLSREAAQWAAEVLAGGGNPCAVHQPGSAHASDHVHGPVLRSGLRHGSYGQP